MKKIVRKYYTALLLLLPLLLIGQKIDNTASFIDIKSNHYIRLLYDNDVFRITDRYYTQGTNLEFADSALDKNPLNYTFPKLRRWEQKYGVALELLAYTPSTIDSSRILYNDRPYAAAAMIKSFRISTDTLHKNRLSFSFSIGIIGQGVGGKQVQSGVHKMIGDAIPQGWQNQINNDLLLNYELSHEKQLCRYRYFLTVNSNAKLHLGSFNTNVGGGLNVVLGKVNSPFSSYKNKNSLQYYGYYQGIATLVGYDSTLQGGLFNRGCPYIINADQISRITIQHNYGIVIQYKAFYIEYSLTELSKEFKSGASHKWGGFRLGAKLR